MEYIKMDDASIWRYMDFTKFVDIISTEELYFSRSDCFEDDFEGSYPEKHVAARLDTLKNESDSIPFRI